MRRLQESFLGDITYTAVIDDVIKPESPDIVYPQQITFTTPGSPGICGVDLELQEMYVLDLFRDENLQLRTNSCRLVRLALAVEEELQECLAENCNFNCGISQASRYLGRVSFNNNSMMSGKESMTSIKRLVDRQPHLKNHLSSTTNRPRPLRIASTLFCSLHSRSTEDTSPITCPPRPTPLPYDLWTHYRNVRSTTWRTLCTAPTHVRRWSAIRARNVFSFLQDACLYRSVLLLPFAGLRTSNIRHVVSGST